MSHKFPVSSNYIETIHTISLYTKRYNLLQKIKEGSLDSELKSTIEDYQQKLKLVMYSKIGSSATMELLTPSRRQ